MNFITQKLIFLGQVPWSTNLFLAILTAIYVILTYRILRINNKTLRSSLIPQIFPSISSQKEIIFNLENYSSNAAYDIDIWLIGIFDEEKIPYKSLLKDKSDINIDFNKTLFKHDEYDFYGIIDRATYAVFPPRSRNSFKPQFQELPNSLFLVMQYKDLLGKNYIYQSWLFRSPKRFHQGFLKYSPLKSAKEIEYGYFFESPKSIFKDIYKYTGLIHSLNLCLQLIITKLRAYFVLDKDIRDILTRSFASGYQKNSSQKNIIIEDRGLFQKL